MHHGFGSKLIVDIFHSYGVSVSYTDTRQFITSLARDELARLRNNIYEPSGIRSRADGGLLIHEGNDNVDINTHTSDGKNTFHLMARVSFSTNK